MKVKLFNEYMARCKAIGKVPSAVEAKFYQEIKFKK